MTLESKAEMRLDQGKKEMKIKQEYFPPLLEKLGDLRSITLGGSIGVTESSYPFGQGDPFPTFEP